MKKIVMMFAVALILVFAAAPSAHAQYPSYWYNYNVYPGGGYYSYNLSNGYESVSVYQSLGYGSAYTSYSYSSPYGWYSRYYSHPTYYYPAYNYSSYNYYYPHLYQSQVRWAYRIR